jgi:RNA polymerase sigma-70 factor (ECF subfamily)
MTRAGNDASVFNRVFDQHRDAVHAYFLGRVADRELTSDLVQETFLRVWRRLGEVGQLPPERQRAWVFTVARNLTVDSYRAGAARRAAEEALRQEAATAEATVAGPHRQAELADDLARLDAAIRDLPEQLRVVLSLATAGGLTSRQIGEALGEPPGTIRYRLSLARKRLAAALDLKESV